MSTKVKHPLHKSFRDDRGNVAITFGLMIIPICGLMGAAIDYSNVFRVKARLQTSVDAAALAAIHSAGKSNEERIALAELRFKSNFAPNDPTSAPTPFVNVTATTALVNASADVGLPILSIFGGSEITVEATSGTVMTGGSHKLEVGMMIDLTGSMGWTPTGDSKTKIESLKTASTDLLNILLPTSGANDSLVKIAVAPFADYVNAGTYAADATGLAASGGSYTNITNLASTKNGTFTGTYAAGTIGSTSGSQAGATSPTSGSWAASTGTTTSGGGTYSSGHCDVTTVSTPVPAVPGATATFESLGNNNSTWPIGKQIETEGSTAPPTVIVQATNSAKIKQLEKYKNNAWKAEDANNSGYWLKVPTTTTGITWATDGTNKIGREVELEGTNTTWPAGLFLASTANPVRKIDKWKNGAWKYSDGAAKTSGRFILVPTSWTAAGTPASSIVTTKPECTTTAQTASSSLITCVTERTGSEAYSDVAPSGSNRVGAYNHGVTSKSNYSSDGKCNVAGRELPKVIPLTNNRSTISTFFTNAKVGGATPGHIGTAWAWYLVSPLWNSVFGVTAAEYADTTTNKAVILMTDGEYNIHYASATSRAQALALCTAMKAKGITVYTIGFGFSTSSTAADNTTEGRAKDLMTQCSSGTNHYYFPYDGAALRQTFADIGNALVAGNSDEVIKVTQ